MIHGKKIEKVRLTLTKNDEPVLMKALPGNGFGEHSDNALVIGASINCNWQFECKEIFLKIATDCNFFFE